MEVVSSLPTLFKPKESLNSESSAKMEQCMVRPDVKNRNPAQPRPTSTPPKPPKISSELGKNQTETQGKKNCVETPAASLKPSHVANMNNIQRERTARIPTFPPRLTEKELSNTVSYRLSQATKTQDSQNKNMDKATSQPAIPPKQTAQPPPNKQKKDIEISEQKIPEVSEMARGETDFRQGQVAMLTEMFEKGPKEPTPTFTSYVSDPDSLKSEEKPEAEEKLTTDNKKGGLKERLKKANPFKSQASVETALSAEEPNPKNDQSGDEVEQERPSEGKLGKVGFIAEMFGGTQKEKTSIPALREALSSHLSVSNGSLSDTSPKEKGGVLSGIFKKSKPSQDGTSTEDNISVHSDLSASDDDSLSVDSSKTKGKGGVLTGIFKKAAKPKQNTQAEEDKRSLHGELSTSDEDLLDKPKGGLKERLKKANPFKSQDKRSLHGELSASNDSLSENGNTKKGGMFGGMFKKKSPKSTEISSTDEDKPTLNDELSRSTGSLAENNSTKEKGNVFSELFRKPQKQSENTPSEEDKSSLHGELSTSDEDILDKPREKGGIFGGMFKKATKPSEEDKGAQFQDEDSSTDLSGSTDGLSDYTKPKEKGGVFGGMFKKSKPHKMSDEDKDSLSSELSASTDDQSENTKPKQKAGVFNAMFKKTKLWESSDEDKDLLCTKLSASSDDLLSENGKTKDNAALDKNLSASNDDLSDNAMMTKEKSAGWSGLFSRSPKPALRTQASTDPLTQHSELSESNDSLFEEIGSSQDLLSVDPELSVSKDNIIDTTKEKKGVLGFFRRSPRPAEQAGTDKDGENKGLVRRETGLKKKRVVSFRVKRVLPREPKFPLKPSGKTPSQEALVEEEPMELQEMSPVQGVTEEEVEVQEVEMAAFPTEGNPLESEGEDDGLMEWWRTVEGWDQWNETTHFKEEEENEAVEAVADRVYMAARLFVHLFNQRGASLQQRILELLAQADAVDHFHKKTVSAAVGGGVASVVGSVATITGLILAPITFGASIIVTAVGISVATAGSITSATANITDTVHAKMDRKKVEKMIQDYQDEVKDIRECLEFVQEGMNTLEEWDFKKYTDSVAKKHLPKSIKHVVKEGGRAGKELMINTDKLISTVQVLGVAGGAAKAAKAISITTGVMSALFLALDIFFLAKDSHDLHKGAKTKFATKIRDVCKELQDGLLELNKVKCQLQKTMDGIEVEAYEEEGEEDEDEDEEDLESDPVKLAQLEQELDQIEEQLDKKVLEEPSKGTSKRGETEKDNEKERKSKKEREKETKSEKEKRNKSEKKEGMAKTQSEISKDDRRSLKKECGEEKESVKEKKEETQEEEKAEKGETELMSETPKKDAEEDASANSSTKESDGKSEKKELKKDKTDREVEKVEEERTTRKLPPTVKHTQGEGGSARSVQNSRKEKSVTERATRRDEEQMKKGKEEDEAQKGEAKSERGAWDSKRERERKSGSANDSHRRREEDRGSNTDGDLKEGGQTVIKPGQERRGGVQKEEKGGEKRESTKSRDGGRAIAGQGFSKQEAVTSRGHRSEQGEGKNASLVGRGEGDYGRRSERKAEGERRGSRQEYWRGEERRGSGHDHPTSTKARSGKEPDWENRGSRPEHGSKRGGGEGRRGSGQVHSSEKQKSAEEPSSSRRSEREARERREERAGKPESQPRVRSIRQEGLDI